MFTLPFQNTDIAHTSFQFLEELSTAYWFSQLLFTSIELGVFDSIQQEFPTTAELAEHSSCKEEELTRILVALERLELIMRVDGRWCNSQLSTRYLTTTSDSYMGHLLLYRCYMQPSWQRLTQTVAKEEFTSGDDLNADEDYALRTFHYVRAMDQLLVQKAKEIVERINPAAWHGPLLDIGGGAGSLGRALLRSKFVSDAKTSLPPTSDLLDLTEVLRAAKEIYNKETDWDGITLINGDFRHFSSTKKYGLIVLSNFLHAYSPQEAHDLLRKAVSLLTPNGMLLIHDYFPDRPGVSPTKGPLYDLAMMLNTYNGSCHKSELILNWLNTIGMAKSQIRDLDTDSSIIVSVRRHPEKESFLPWKTKLPEEWIYAAREEGFAKAVFIRPAQIAIGPWVQIKCQYGCERFGQNLQCPPNSMDHTTTREMIDSYSWGILVEGAPPGRSFHEKLLALEKKAFLSGFHKAFTFSAGHCPICDKCPTDGSCKFPGKSRPSMEASGIDVYETATRAGLTLRPVQEKMQYVKYLGLLMLD